MLLGWHGAIDRSLHPCGMSVQLPGTREQASRPPAGTSPTSWRTVVTTLRNHLAGRDRRVWIMAACVAALLAVNGVLILSSLGSPDSTRTIAEVDKAEGGDEDREVVLSTAEAPDEEDTSTDAVVAGTTETPATSPAPAEGSVAAAPGPAGEAIVAGTQVTRRTSPTTADDPAPASPTAGAVVTAPPPPAPSAPAPTATTSAPRVVATVPPPAPAPAPAPPAPAPEPEPAPTPPEPDPTPAPRPTPTPTTPDWVGAPRPPTVPTTPEWDDAPRPPTTDE